jgi:hypothetical protein
MLVTATSNDSFIGGMAGAGYAYLDDLAELQLQRYATRERGVNFPSPAAS